MNIDSKIYIAGHRGMVGGAILRKLLKEGYHNIVTRTSRELDLRNQQSVFSFFEEERPEFVFLAAAKVGGIIANNTYRAEFIYDNLMMECNVIHASYQFGVKKLQFLGSSCIYPKFAPQPLSEDSLLTGKLEYTNEPYAIAKIAGIKLCEAYRDQYNCNFISVMPTNLYGIGDNYHPENSHVLPGLIRRFYESKINNIDEVVIWGTGTPRREFLFSEDLADACVFLMHTYNEKELINIGVGEDVTIMELAMMIAKTVGYTGRIINDTSKPDGTPRKLMNVDKIHKLGWRHKVNLQEGLKMAYEDFLQKFAN